MLFSREFCVGFHKVRNSCVSQYLSHMWILQFVLISPVKVNKILVQLREEVLS